MTSPWQSSEEFELTIVEMLPSQRSRRGDQSAEAGPISGCDTLSDSVIVIPTNGGGRVFPDPIQALDRIGPIVHNVAQKQTDIERFLDRGERRPIRVYV